MERPVVDYSQGWTMRRFWGGHDHTCWADFDGGSGLAGVMSPCRNRNNQWCHDQGKCDQATHRHAYSVQRKKREDAWNEILWRRTARLRPQFHPRLT